MNREASIQERQAVINTIRKYDSFYITYNFALYSLEDLYLLKHHLEKDHSIRRTQPGK